LERSIVHLNVADFAVAVERQEQAGLHDRPVIVAPPGGRSLVYDMSEEAYQTGVRKGMVLERARKLCREARVLPPRPLLYQRAMSEMFRLALPYSPLVEGDEHSGHVFLDLTGTGRLWGPARDVAWRIRREAKARLGLRPIWGLAVNKLVAKIATRVVKPDGEHVVPPGGEEAFLRPLPLHLLPGLEREDLRTLASFHLSRVGQVALWTPEQLEVVFARRGGLLHRLLRGVDNSPVLAAGSGPQRVVVERQFAGDTNDVAQVDRAIFLLAEGAGRRLREMGRVARRISLTLYYSDGMRTTRQRGHVQGTANDFILFDLARQALAAAWARRVRLSHLRLVSDRLAFPSAQMDLPLLSGPSQALQARQERLVEALDRIRGRHGQETIRLGRALGE
jgi:DNA polymerase-4